MRLSDQLLSLSRMSEWEYIESLKSQRTSCDECMGTLVESQDNPAELTIYTRQGVKFAQHFHKECPNRWYRKTFFHGYSVKQGKKVYDPLNHSRKYLITSRETAFAVDFCYELTLHILHNNASFQGYTDVFNQFHNFNKNNLKRQEMNRKRLSIAFFLYGFLEYTSRSGIKHEFKSGDRWLEDTIMEFYNVIKGHFSHHWTSNHFCSVANCDKMMVSDGGMKINRAVCAAKFSAVRKFLNSNKTILTGCTASPNPGSPFCSKHLRSESPVILAENLSKQTKDVLTKKRNQEKYSSVNLPEDSVYIIQSVSNIRKKNKTTEFLVKFAGFGDIECWEPVENLPSFVREFYLSDKTNLCKRIPGPRVSNTTKVKNGTEIYIELDWNQNDNSKEVLDVEEDLFDIDADRLCDEELRSSCNTRKVKDKQNRRHTAGILISSKPCGIIPHVDELFGSESIKQVHGSIVEFLGTMSPEALAALKCWFYDDMCHLKPYSEKKCNKEASKVACEFANLSKAVDKFHFPGHKKTDKYCQENCNPKVELKTIIWKLLIQQHVSKRSSG